MDTRKRYRLLDIIHGLTTARAHASVMAEESPVHAERLNKFSSDLSSLQTAFLDQLKRDGLYARPPFEVD
jgi:hypothetical protein